MFNTPCEYADQDNGFTRETIRLLVDRAQSRSDATLDFSEYAEH